MIHLHIVPDDSRLNYNVHHHLRGQTPRHEAHTITVQQADGTLKVLKDRTGQTITDSLINLTRPAACLFVLDVKEDSYTFHVDRKSPALYGHAAIQIDNYRDTLRDLGYTEVSSCG